MRKPKSCIVRPYSSRMCELGTKSCIKNHKKLKVEIEFSLLEKIAKFYQFPVAVFLGTAKMFKVKTREEYYKKKLEKIRKIVV